MLGTPELIEVEHASTSVLEQCAQIAALTEHATAELSSHEDMPMNVVQTAAEKAENVVDLLTNLASECAQQMNTLLDEIGATAGHLWPDGPDSISELQEAVDGSEAEIYALLPPATQWIRDAAGEIESLAEKFGTQTTAATESLASVMADSSAVVGELLEHTDSSLDQHARHVDETAASVGETCRRLAGDVQDMLVAPFTACVNECLREAEALRSEWVAAPIAEAKRTINDGVGQLENAVTSVCSEFDSAVGNFCETLAGHDDKMGGQSSSTRELTELVKPVFEDIVSGLPGVKEIGSIVGVSL
jgi:hypothetical protein